MESVEIFCYCREFCGKPSRKRTNNEQKNWKKMNEKRHTEKSNDKTHFLFWLSLNGLSNDAVCVWLCGQTKVYGYDNCFVAFFEKTYCCLVLNISTVCCTQYLIVIWNFSTLVLYNIEGWLKNWVLKVYLRDFAKLKSLCIL